MFTHISERVWRLGYFKKIVWQGNTHDPDVCLWLSCFSAFHGSGITQNLRNFSIWIIFHALFFEPNILLTISDESDETKWTWGQIPNQTLVTRQLEQAEIIILLFFDCLIFFLEEPENFVGVPVQASGWGLSSRRRNGFQRAESPKCYSSLATASESWKHEAHCTTCRQLKRSSFLMHSWTSSRRVWFVSASCR